MIAKTDRPSGAKRRALPPEALGASVLLLGTAIMLGFGNAVVPEVPYRDFTPFEVGGVSFFVGVLSLAGLLAYCGAWGTLRTVVVLYHVAMTALVTSELGAIRGALWGSVAVGVYCCAWWLRWHAPHDAPPSHD